MTLALRYYNQGKIHSIGAWYITAPFKIMLINRKGIIENPKTDEVLLPIGREVSKGIDKCINKNYSFANNQNKLKITDNENKSITGNAYGDLSLVHNMRKEMAKLANSRPLHIDSGLWLLGKGLIEI